MSADAFYGRFHSKLFILFLFQAFDLKNGWNSKNKDQSAKGRWSEGAGGSRNPVKDWAKPLLASESFSRDQYGWLCDLINQFGDQNGFELVS